jgi:hypothetical protein
MHSHPSKQNDGELLGAVQKFPYDYKELRLVCCIGLHSCRRNSRIPSFGDFCGRRDTLDKRRNSCKTMGLPCLCHFVKGRDWQFW